MLILKVLRWVLRILTWFLDFGILIFRFSMLELVKVEISKFSSLKLFELSWFEYENNPDNGVLNKGQGVISQSRDLDFWTLRHQISKNGNFRFKILNASRDMVDAKMARTLRKISWKWAKKPKTWKKDSFFVEKWMYEGVYTKYAFWSRKWGPKWNILGPWPFFGPFGAFLGVFLHLPLTLPGLWVDRDFNFML